MGDDITLENVFICSTDPDYDEALDFDEVTKDWTQDDIRAYFDDLSDRVGDWQGIPVPLGPEMPLVLHDKHPLREVFGASGPDIEIVVGGPIDIDEGTIGGESPEDIDAAMARAFDRTREERVVNRWYDASHNRDVLIFKRNDGTAFAVKVPRPPNNSMDRLDLWVQTMIASDAWDFAAETKAMEKLAGIVTPRQFRHYVLTGSFLETSKKSGLVYIFRRLRPTIVLTGNQKWWRSHIEGMRCIAVLCMHPVGHYQSTWAGCMVPTDDVIAHVLHMRADEAYFWRKANQHDPASAEAGL